MIHYVLNMNRRQTKAKDKGNYTTDKITKLILLVSTHNIKFEENYFVHCINLRFTGNLSVRIQVAFLV